jgi:hypothetical protein
MTKLSWFGVIFSLFLLVAPAQAQDDPMAMEWQAVVTGQVEAFRHHDAPVALSFAATSFHDNFPDPDQFFQAIAAWGYGPIMESRSHSFGRYELVKPEIVLQVVKFVGPDQGLYEAIYQLNKETDGWRIGGVQLVKTPGVGV